MYSMKDKQNSYTQNYIKFYTILTSHAVAHADAHRVAIAITDNLNKLNILMFHLLEPSGAIEEIVETVLKVVTDFKLDSPIASNERSTLTSTDRVAEVAKLISSDEYFELWNKVVDDEQ